MTDLKTSLRNGRRYSPAKKALILKDAEELGAQKAAAKHDCSIWSIYEWRKKGARAATKPSQEESFASEPANSVQEECQPANPAQEERRQRILEIWRQQPGLGPSQIRNQLKREGLKASVNTVRAIMEEHGYVQPRIRRKEHTGRYEATRPLQLFHLDFCHFHVHRQKQCLLMIIDDFSRFIPGWTLLKSEHAAGVIETFESIVGRYGKPEAVMTASPSCLERPIPRPATATANTNVLSTTTKPSADPAIKDPAMGTSFEKRPRDPTTAHHLSSSKPLFLTLSRPAPAPGAA